MVVLDRLDQRADLGDAGVGDDTDLVEVVLEHRDHGRDVVGAEDPRGRGAVVDPEHVGRRNDPVGQCAHGAAQQRPEATGVEGGAEGVADALEPSDERRP